VGLDAEGRVQGGQQLVGDDATMLALLDLDQCHELVGTGASENVRVAQHPAQALGDLA
jgi:hypothetical protein